MRYFENCGIFNEAKELVTDLNELCYVEIGREWNYKNVMSAFTRIYLPKSGEGVVYTDNERIELKPNNVYVIPAYTKFSCECEDKLVKIYAHVSVVKQDGTEAFANIGRVLSAPDVGFCDQLIELTKGDDIASLIKIKQRIFDALLYVCESEGVKLQSQKRYSALVRDSIGYINQNLSASLKIGEIAQKFSVAGVTLQQRFTKEVGVPIGKFIDQKLMMIAEKELVRGELNVGEIAEMLGFCDRFYFSRRFCNWYGVSPKKYLKSRGT